MKSRPYSTPLFLLLLLFTAAASLAEWPTYHGDPDLRGVADIAMPESPSLLWRVDAGSEIMHPPVSDGERIFLATRDGRLLALSLNGTRLWEHSLWQDHDTAERIPPRMDSPPACGGELLLAASGQGLLVALDAQTGRERWRYDIGGNLVGSPNFIRSNGVILLDQTAGILHALDLETGAQRWETPSVGRCDASPGVGDGRIAFGSCDAALHVFREKDGTHLRDIPVNGASAQIAGGTAIDGTLAFAGLRDGSLVCVDLESGGIVWISHESRRPTFSTPAVTDDLVIYTSDNGVVYAVEKPCGALRWKIRTGGLPGSPIATGDRVAISSEGTLYLLRLDDGKKLWSRTISDRLTPPAWIGGMLVVGADDGTISAFGQKEKP